MKTSIFTILSLYGLFLNLGYSHTDEWITGDPAMLGTAEIGYNIIKSERIRIDAKIRHISDFYDNIESNKGLNDYGIWMKIE